MIPILYSVPRAGAVPRYSSSGTLTVYGFLVCLLAALSLVTPAHAHAQSDHGFQFVRIRYEAEEEGRFGRRRGGGPWSHDWPRAEEHLYMALKRTTAIYVEEPPLVLTLSDDRIFEHPVLYLCEPGYWQMTDEEAERVRQYLDRGGFILFDDFGGQREWRWFYEQMKRIFPDREPTEIAPDHPIWSIYYDIDPIAAPSLVSRREWGQGEDRYMAYFDETGRMVVLANHNQDIGDGWEYPEENFQNASTISFQMGINFIMYALTH